MIRKWTKRILLGASVAIVTPALALAQAPRSAPPSEQELQTLFSEMQEVHQQLEVLQAEALQDASLSADQERLGEEIREAMQRLDPMMNRRMARVQAIESEAIAAQQANDGQKLQALMGEAQQIQQHFMMVQESALEEPEIASRLADFQSRLEAKMIAVNPSAEALLTRFRELEDQIEAAMFSGG